MARGVRPTLFTPAQLAVLLEVSERTVYAMAERGEIELTKVGSRSYVTREAVKALLERRALEAV